MSFGDWEMFKVLLISLREHEITSVLHQNEIKPTRTAKHPERRGKVHLLTYLYAVSFFPYQ